MFDDSINTTNGNKNNPVFNSNAIIQELQTVCRGKGLDIPGDLQPGKMTRFRTGNDHNLNGYVVLFVNDDGSAGACFGDWKTIKENWFYTPEGRTLSREERQQFRKQMEQTIKAAEQARAETQKKAAIEAKRIWSQAQSVDPSHPYLTRKQIQPHGLKQAEERLLVPVMDKTGDIGSLQTINPDGSKLFHTGGKVQGGFYILGNPDKSDTVYIGEGFATCATINELTGKAVYIAFNSGNLKAVGEIIKKRHPEKKIIIAADNDLDTKKRTGKNPGRDAAENAAKVNEVDMALCPVDSDFNDLFCQQGADAVRGALREVLSMGDWGEPISLDEHNRMDINPTSFPGITGAMIKAVSQATETPFELSAGIILAVLGTACQGKFMIQIKEGYKEPLNLWVVVALEPANRKSSTLVACTKPLTQWEKKQRIDMEQDIKKATVKRSLQESRLKSLKAKYGKAKPGKLDEIEEEIISIENNLVEIPMAPQIWCQDVTPEHLGTLMGMHGEKMAILSAEGGIFDIIGGRYSNGVPNLDLFLQSHSGDPVRVDRGSREPVNLDNPCLTLGLSPQPDVLRGMASKPGFSGRGLTARPLYFLPKSTLGYRTLDTEPVPQEIKLQYAHMVHSLLDITPSEKEDGTPQPYILNLSKDAHREWNEFAQTVEVGLREGGQFESIQGWAGKLPGAAARIAGLLHCSENTVEPWSKPVSLETMRNALDIAAIFSSHTLVVFDLMGADKNMEQARKVWKWIKRNGQRSFKKRDCFNALKGSFPRMSEIKEPLKILQERNYIKEDRQKTGGRPSIICHVNPSLMEGE